jgi:hypothetical protein
MIDSVNGAYSRRAPRVAWDLRKSERNSQEDGIRCGEAAQRVLGTADATEVFDRAYSEEEDGLPGGVDRRVEIENANRRASPDINEMGAADECREIAMRPDSG